MSKKKLAVREKSLQREPRGTCWVITRSTIRRRMIPVFHPFFNATQAHAVAKQNAKRTGRVYSVWQLRAEYFYA